MFNRIASKMNMRTAFYVLSAIILSCFISNQTLSQEPPCKGIATSKGLVNGVYLKESNICAFLGIPYAAPPLGELRFALPTEHEPWNAPLETVKIASQCPQTPSPMTDTSIPMNEDCLYLNIWAPVSIGSEKKPVMVFIHGGGFIVGSGGNSSYNGTNLSSMGDVIVVTVNYRLGVLGFLAHPAFADATGRTGNWGLYDQLAALRWVNQNIPNFGGDPGNVTLFGQSAGGMSVGLHLASPLSAGLFSKVAIHSGPPILLNISLDKGVATALDIASKLGCSEASSAASCLRSASIENILAKIPLGIFVMDTLEAQNKSFVVPIIDGAFIPEAPYSIFNNGGFNKDVIVMLGTTKDEASYFTMKKTLKTEKDFNDNLKMDIDNVAEALGVGLSGKPGDLEALFPVAHYPTVEKAYQDFICDAGFTCPTELLAEMILAHQPEVYRFYHTKDPVKMLNLGAFHGSELPYVFGNFGFMGQQFRSKDNLKLAKTAISLWSSFARTGAPSADSVPNWPKYDLTDRSYMILGDKIEIGASLKKEKCEPLSGFFKANME